MRRFCLGFICTLLAIVVSAQETDLKLVVIGEGANKTDATKMALRSAIEQAFGVFVSANTEILNDEMIRDQVATLSSGNIKSYKELGVLSLPNGNVCVSVEAHVSIGDLVTYAKAHGSAAEFAGQTFMMNMKMRKLNKESEAEVLMQILRRLSLTADSFFNYRILRIKDPREENYYETGKGYSDNTKRERHGYVLPLEISPILNKNFYEFEKYLINTLTAITLTEKEHEQYINNHMQPALLNVNLSGERESARRFYLRNSSSFVSAFSATIASYLNFSATNFSIIVTENGVDNEYSFATDPVRNAPSKDKYLIYNSSGLAEYGRGDLVWDARRVTESRRSHRIERWKEDFEWLGGNELCMRHAVLSDVYDAEIFYPDEEIANVSNVRVAPKRMRLDDKRFYSGIIGFNDEVFQAADIVKGNEAGRNDISKAIFVDFLNNTVFILPQGRLAGIHPTHRDGHTFWNSRIYIFDDHNRSDQEYRFTKVNVSESEHKLYIELEGSSKDTLCTYTLSF